MENSKLRDKLKKEKKNSALEFVKKNLRYFAAGALFLILVLVLVTCSGSKNEPGIETEQTSEVDAFEEVNTLVSEYYTAYAAGDLDTLTTLANPVSANEQSYIALFSQYVDEYQNVKCYTQNGLDANSYMVSVAMEIKFTGVEKAAPGLDFFYIRTNDEGKLYIDNLYSQYNFTNKDNALDTSVENLINEYMATTDMIALKSEIQANYDAAVASDESLSTMIDSTIPDAINQWMIQVKAENAQQVAEGTEAVEETTEVTEETQQSEQNEETTEQTTEKLATTDRVNVRAEANTDSEKLGTLEAGTVVTRTGVDGDWSIIDYNGTTGYVKNEYLTYNVSEEQENEDDSAESEEETGNSSNLTEGTEIRLQNTVNIRSGMSETADRIGTAYAGEKVTVVMSYAEGWTKVKWNGETGYIKTSLLQ